MRFSPHYVHSIPRTFWKDAETGREIFFRRRGRRGSSESQENLAVLVGKISTDNILCNIPTIKYKPTIKQIEKTNKVETKKWKECEGGRPVGN